MMTVPEAVEVLEIAAADYLGLPAVTRVAPRWRIEVVPRAQRPDVEDLERDWVATVAAPAFRLLRAERGEAACRRFLALGAGPGVDALAAVEILGAREIGLTDLYEDVVAAAEGNVRRNLRSGQEVALRLAAGDLAEPWRGIGAAFELIYENLTNLPLADPAALAVGRTSAAFFPPRPEPTPPSVARWLLTLHYLALAMQSTSRRSLSLWRRSCWLSSFAVSWAATSCPSSISSPCSCSSASRSISRAGRLQARMAGRRSELRARRPPGCQGCTSLS